MLRLIGLVVSIGLADSLNPSTIAPGLYLALGRHPRPGLIQFTAGVFAVNLLGGAIIALGPGEALLAIVPKPDATARYIAETVAGVVVLIAAAVLWRRRKSLAQRELPTSQTQGRSAFLLGATIAVVELPTALPYFAVIAAVVGSGLNPFRQLILLALYNIAFVLPLILMILTLIFAPERAERILRRARDVLQRRWPVLLAGLAVLAGAFVTVIGITGLAGRSHGSVGHLSRKLRRAITR